jgi:hypothetical protein
MMQTGQVVRAEADTDVDLERLKQAFREFRDELISELDEMRTDVFQIRLTAREAAETGRR